MSHNSFGRLFSVTTFGESHGPAVGCVVDGMPPDIAVSEDDIQPWLDRRRPGQSRYTTQRQEEDRVRILSGVFEGRSTGTPIAMLIDNTDQRSKDYGTIKDVFRPGHADYTYRQKYTVRDHRGGGRASARETACRVAAGALARLVIGHILGKNAYVQGALVQVGPHEVEREALDALWHSAPLTGLEDNPFWCPLPAMVETWAAHIDAMRVAGRSTGAVIEVRAKGFPAGLGAPLYGKLDSDLATALMSINAVKGVEIGDGFAVAALDGVENADEMRMQDGEVTFDSNHAGGILGGISSGQDIIARFAVKPTSSILTPRKTVDVHGNETEVSTKGRHDPCVGIRAVPIGEAMMAIVLADHILRHRGQCG